MKTPSLVILRLLRLIAILFVVSTMCFFSLSLLPGDPARAILGDTSATPQAIAALHHQLGLDHPLFDRFTTWLGNVLHGDLGSSYRTGQPVMTIIRDRAPVTIELIVISQLMALTLAIPAAIAAAYRRRRTTDRLIGLWVFTALSVPDFVLGVLLIYVASVKFGMFPATGWVPISSGLGANLQSAILPSAALAAASFALYQRVLRSDLTETLKKDYITVASAKGVSPWRVTVRHALRPSLLGLVTTVGVTVGTLIGSTVIVENLFSLPGLGNELATAVSGRDYIEVQGIVLVIATSFVVINALVDLLYGLIDPRLSAARTFGKGATQ